MTALVDPPTSATLQPSDIHRSNGDGTVVRAPSDAWLPSGTRVVFDSSVRREGGVLVGGAPPRIIRLAPAGNALLDKLAAGHPVPRTRPAQRTVRRLMDAGILHPIPVERHAGRGRATVVIPVRDDPKGLTATVSSLERADERSRHRDDSPDATAAGASISETVVVDDGSTDPLETLVASKRKLTVVGHVASRGPAAARNSGWKEAETDLIAFVDAGCRLPRGWLDRLACYLDDPTVGAVAPRIVPLGSTKTPTWLTAYEKGRSPLDLGDRPAPVRPRSWVPYVPTAVLLVRRQALESIGGFDESLRTGEDVDLVWRLHQAGWRVRYQPEVVVAHPVRASLGGWARQRFGYGKSAAALARRHGDAVAPLDASPWTAAAWGLVGSGHPVLGAGVAAGTVGALAVRQSAGAKQSDDRTEVGRELVRLGTRGQLAGGQAVATAVTRTWWPVAALAAVGSKRARLALGAAAVVPALSGWRRRRPSIDPIRWTALHMADDFSYGAGVWAGCWKDRSAKALLPARSGSS